MDRNIFQAVKDAARNIGNAYYSEDSNQVTATLARCIAESLRCIKGKKAQDILANLAAALNSERNEL